ncbi:MAG: phosphate acyltransferase [Spirochaetia bacterium]|jgi:phosphate butyryltransferase|nr:phosphate acyltransferase [Spirochaetia bacterium]
MKEINSLDELVDRVKSLPKKKIAVAFGQDPYTIESLAKAVKEGLADAVLIGEQAIIESVCSEKGIDSDLFEIRNNADAVSSCKEAVAMIHNGKANVIMKGLVGTDKFLKAVMDKEKGLLPPGAIMSYVGALDIPKYDKLLFISDPAVIPFPDLKQKAAMVNYSVAMAHKLGIEKPKVSLVSCTEKVNPGIPNTLTDSMLCKMNDRGQFLNCTIDGPLDIFLSCDTEAVTVKGIPTPINGEADILIFPTLEASNVFYKGLMLFADAELAGLIQGTTHPVIVMSRSESAKSKFYCIALSCLMADLP